MLAVIEKVENGFTVLFERYLNHSVEEEWSYLTVNDKLESWFTELRVDELREGGCRMGLGLFIEFSYNN